MSQKSNKNFASPQRRLEMLYNIFYGKVENTQRNAGELVANILKQHNVEFIFTLIGGHVSPVIVEAEKVGIRVIDVRHEATAVFAADAMSRLSGTTGVAVVTAGPGLTNTVTALKNAQMAQVPLILISGASPLLLQNRGSLQDIDQIKIVSSIVKHSVRCKSINNIVQEVNYAFQIANDGVPGPVFIEIPVDLLYHVQELQTQMGFLERKSKAQVKPEDIQRICVPLEQQNKNSDKKQYFDSLPNNAYIYLHKKNKLPIGQELFLSYKLNLMYGNAFSQTQVQALELKKYMISPNIIDKCIKLILQSKTPLIILGSQAMLNVNKVKHIKEALNFFKIPFYCSGMARGLSENALKFDRGKALQMSDLVLLFGVQVDFRLNYGKVFSKKSKIVTVNRSLEDLNKNTDVFWSPFLKIQTDPGEFLIKLLSQIRSVKQFQPENLFIKWNQDLNVLQQKKIKALETDANQPVFGHDQKKNQELINPLKIFLDLNKIYNTSSDSKVIYIGDGGDFVATAAYSLQLKNYLSWLDPGPFGTLGCGAGYALASKLLHPDAEVIIIWGDGSSGYGLMEFDTFVRHKLNIKAIIGNDACWKQIERDQKIFLGRSTACMLAYSDYEKVAMSLGAKGSTLDSTSQLTQALNDMKNSQFPYVLNIMIGESKFREGSISI